MTTPKDSYAEAKLKAADSFDGECTPLEALWFYRGSDFGRAYSDKQHEAHIEDLEMALGKDAIELGHGKTGLRVRLQLAEAEIEELKSKLSASEWVRKDNALRTYDGLTEKLQSKDAEIAELKESLAFYKTHNETFNEMWPTNKAKIDSRDAIIATLERALIKVNELDNFYEGESNVHVLSALNALKEFRSKE